MEREQLAEAFKPNEHRH